MESQLDIAVRLRPKVVSYLLRVSRNTDDAEDAVQDAYAKIWHKLDKVGIAAGDEVGMMRYMCVVARNTYYDTVRKRSRRAQLSITAANYDADWFEDLPASLIDYATPEDEAIRNEHNEAVDAAFSAGISALTEPHRDLIKAVVSGETPKEYATRNGVPTGTISFRSWSARQRIKSALAELPFGGD